MKLAHVNYAFDPRIPTAHDLLDAYHTLTGWSDAAALAGLSVDVVQAFVRNARVDRGAVAYRFCASHGWRAYAQDGLHRAVAALHPDVVHVNGLDMVHHAWQLRRYLAPEVALVVQDHGSIPPRRATAMVPLRRFLMRAVDGFLFTSLEQARPWLDDGFIGDAARVHQVQEASTDLRPIGRAAAREQCGVNGNPAVLWVGRLDDNKDPLTVLAGFDRILDVCPGATLTMVYTGTTLLPAVRQRIAQSARLGRSVRLAGAVAHGDIAAYFSAADLFVLGSAREAAGYAVIEACACGAVPVVTDIPPFRAITGDGAIGRLWRHGSADACAAALVDAYRAAGERQRDEVLARFARHLSWPEVGRRAAAVYEAVVEARRARQVPRSARAKLSASPCRAELPTSNASSITERPSSMR